MSTPNDNLFVKLIKKSVGLPTGKSDCCGAPAGVQSNDCCGSSGVSSCCGPEASPESSTGCCGNGGGDCCGAETAEGAEGKVESGKEA